MTVPDFVPAELERIGVVLAPDRLLLLERFIDLLLDENTRHNLTGITDRDESWRRHVVDSLTLLPHLAGLPANARVVDVGSGGGLPGIPLAIARPDLRFLLVEATGKKARFLEAALIALELEKTAVRNERAETVGHEPPHRQQFAVAVSRALGPMRELLEYTLPFVKPGGVLLALKGRDVAQELQEAATALKRLGGGEVEVLAAYPPGFGRETTLVKVKKMHSTPPDYPRRPGLPRHEPL